MSVPADGGHADAPVVETAPTAPIASVVVATDFSEPASVALAWGRRLASRHGAKLVLAHVLGGAADHHLTKDEARKGLDAIALPSNEDAIHAEVDLSEGPVAARLAEAASRHGADLLVIGSHGHGVLKRLLLGSVADELLRICSVPLFIVHPRDARRPIRFQTALAGVDFSDASRRATRLALRAISREPGARLLLLSATQLPMTFVGPDAPALPLVDVAEVSEPAREGICRLTKELAGVGPAIEGLVCPGAPGEAILDTAEDRGADFVAVGSEPRSGAARFLLGSVAIDVVHQAVCPVLVGR